MTRHTLLTFCILLTAMVAQAAPITLEKARENAMAFLSSGNMQQRVKGNRNLKLAYTRNGTNGVAAPLFHVFNIGDGGGFVIASADDVAVPVLGYCDKGTFSPDDIPVNMQAWLEGYSEEIGKARENGVVAKGDAPVYASRKKINPMIKSTWDQGTPYNDMCVFNGTSYLTGCVATGMAQIMYYWATTGIDGKKFKCGSTALPAYITESQHLSVGALDALTTFDWDSMTDGIPTTTKGKTAVARLMRYCGQSVQMDYDEDGSGAALEDAAEALKNNFGYNYSMQVVYSFNMSEEEWQEMAYKELNEGKPFFMSGQGTDGHAFICDGYDPSNGTFHFNWGWGGHRDGWFAMTSLKPGGHDFSSMRWGIKGIQPFSGSPYAILSSDGKTLSFYCDTKRKERTGTLCQLGDSQNSSPSWNGAEVEQVVFDSSFSEARPISTYNWFYGMTKLKKITGLSYLNTSDVTKMRGMFYDCNNLENIDASHFDTSKVTDMSNMFRGCGKVKALDLSNFNTSRVTKMYCMFYECINLESLDVSKFNTSNVDDMSYMFKNCRKLKTLDVSHFDTSKVTDMSVMFYRCNALTSLDVSHFNTSKVTNMSSMFYECSSVKKLDVSHFDTSKVTDMGAMFTYCGSLESLDVSHFDMSHVKNVHWLFASCSSLQDLYIPATLPELDDWGCLGVGTKSAPCRLHAPTGFNFGFTPPANEAFEWKEGWFILADGYDAFAMGDVNHDGQVNITDVTIMVDYVLGGQPQVFYKENADMNHDGQVNITDISTVVNITLGL